MAAGGAVVAFVLGQYLDRIAGLITVPGAVGLSVFAVFGAAKAQDHEMGWAQAIILGTITAAGGGTLRDTLIGQPPSVLSTGFYAVPALVGAAMTVTVRGLGAYGLPAVLVAAGVCFLIRILGVHFSLDAPHPPGMEENPAIPQQR